MGNNYCVPLIARSKANTKYNLTGSWRTGSLPFFTSPKISPCELFCPLNQEVPEILELIKKEKYKEAWIKILEKNPFPATCGRICKGFCKDACNRKYYDGAVNFKEIERFLGDEALRNGWNRELFLSKYKNEKIAVIGAGPAGLAVAYFLSRKGIQVEIFETENTIGGMLKFVPPFKLPKTIFSAETWQNILYKNDLIRIFFKANLHENFVKNVLKNDFYRAVIIATGNNAINELSIKKVESSKIVGALDFLSGLQNQKKSNFSKIIVIGGGNTAVDAARVAKRIFSKANVAIIMREDEKNIPAYKEEIELAVKEKIEIIYSAIPKVIIEKDRLEIEFEELETTESYNGELSFKPKNTLFKETADLVITALGFKSDTPFLNYLDEEQKEKVFIAGDTAISKAQSLPSAIASAKNVVEEAAFFMKTGKRNELKKGNFEIAAIEDINLAYFPLKPAFCSNITNCHSSQDIFKELMTTWEKDIVKEEAGRCFYCGKCVKCNNCFDFCPDLAIVKKEEKYEIREEYCKGCLICVKECPRGLIKTKDS